LWHDSAVIDLKLWLPTITASLVACTPPSAPEQRVDPVVPVSEKGAADNEVVDNGAAQAPATGDLDGPIYAFKQGSAWTEAVQMDLYSHRGGEPLPERPTLRERRLEAFEILEPTAEGHRIRVRVNQIWLESADGSSFDTGAEIPPPAKPHLLDRISYLGSSCVFRLDAHGAIFEIEGEADYRAAFRASREALYRTAKLVPEQSSDELLEVELAGKRAWGLRPRLPANQVVAGETWTESIRTASMFNSEATWSIKHTRSEGASGEWSATRSGDATFQPTPVMALFLRSAQASLQGSFRVELETGAFVASETTILASVDAAPQPKDAFAGGKMILRRVVTRERVPDDAPSIADTGAP